MSVNGTYAVADSNCFIVFLISGAVIAATPALAACNAAFGVCEGACVAALLAFTP